MSDPTVPAGDAPAAQPAPDPSQNPDPSANEQAASTAPVSDGVGGLAEDDPADDSPPESFAAASWAEHPPSDDELRDHSGGAYPNDLAAAEPEPFPDALPEPSLEEPLDQGDQAVVTAAEPELQPQGETKSASAAGDAVPVEAVCDGCATCPQAAAEARVLDPSDPMAPPPSIAAAPGGDAIDRSKPARPSVIVRYGVMRNIGEFRHNVDPPPPRGAKVVIRTERGVELGEVVTPVSREGCACGFITADGLRDFVRNNGPEYPFRRDGRVLRVANPQDVIDYRHLQQSAREAAKYCRQEIRDMGTDMKLVTVEHLLGGERIIFYFASESRVDFRDLVRRLASQYRTRIEMRQVGARDEARLVGDYERCGQQCCCQSYMKDLKPVSMRMAKTQKATLDPSKISGRCGRLMCCLRYEDIAYEELRKKLPRKNIFVRTATVVGKVVDTQIITQLVRLLLVDNTTVVVGNDEILERDVEAPIRPEVRVRPAPPPRGEPVYLRSMADEKPRDGQPPAGGPAGPQPAAAPAGADGPLADAAPGEPEALGGAVAADDGADQGPPEGSPEGPGDGQLPARRGPEGEGSAEGEGGKKRRRRRSRHRKGGPDGQGPDQGQGQGQGPQGPGQQQGRGPRPPGGPQGDRQRPPRGDRPPGPRDDRQPRNEPRAQFGPPTPGQPAGDVGGGAAEDIARPPAPREDGPPAGTEEFRPPAEAPSRADDGQDFAPQDSGGPDQDFDDAAPGGEPAESGPAPAQNRPGPGGGPPQGQGQGQGGGRRRRRHRGGRRPPK